MPAAPLKVFICYAREDRDALGKLMGHLAVFERNGTVQFWYDHEITGGKDWDETIRFNLKTADIVLLLISPDFFLSDYIHSVELKEALQRDLHGEALVVPVILKKCLWHKHPEIARLQALPAEGHPVYDWTRPDDGFYDVAEGFDRILEDPEMRVRVYNKLAREKGLPEMVLVKGGTFQMGGSEYDDEKPIHPVTLSDFLIGKYPVTVKQWVEVTGYYPSSLPKEYDDCPVDRVSWDDVQEFIQNLNKKTGQKYRLPTEAEWEYAARGGQASKGFKYAGSNDIDEVAWNLENSEEKQPFVGKKKPNELGIYDMSGYVGEWCEDDWHDSYESAPQDGRAWVERPRGVDRVVRSGGCTSNLKGCSVSNRSGDEPSFCYFNVGFRLALQL